MGEHKDRSVIGRSVPPPSFPCVVCPCTANWTKDVAAQDPGAYVLERLLGEVVVDACAPSALPQHLFERVGSEKPFVECGPTGAERILQILFWTASDTVDLN